MDPQNTPKIFELPTPLFYQDYSTESKLTSLITGQDQYLNNACSVTVMAEIKDSLGGVSNLT
jgi:hypothetical protein